MRITVEYLNMLQSRIDMVANNLANVSTPGFKESLLSIEESYDLQERSNTVAQYGGVMPGAENAEILNRNLYVGKRIDFSQGSLAETGNPLDMAINGEGFFQVRTPGGNLGYTRAGMFSTDRDGNLVNNEGMKVEPAIRIPATISKININSDGAVLGVLMKGTEEGADGFDGFGDLEEEAEEQTIEIGRISLYKFANPDGLEQMGHNIYLPTAASGEGIPGTPGAEGYGEIKAGMIEKANTDLTKAIASLIEAQRAYQFDLRIAKNQDEMTQMAIMMRG